MAKLTIMRGLPASGKSTMAKQLIEERGNTVRINKDLLRKMLHFDNFTPRNEGFTRDASRKMAESFLKSGINVIIDDTNLNPKTLQSWVDLAKQTDSKIEHCVLTTSVDECITRDMNRRDSVGLHVIYKMALQYQDFLKGAKIVLVDLDGTLCDIEHRRHFVSDPENKDWKGFYAGIKYDLLREDVKKQAEELATKEGAHIMFVSARPETYREETERWLSKYGMNSPLLMREENDTREDSIVKSEIFDKYLKNLQIVGVFDDRPRVIRMWREKGLNVIDVGDGIEF